MTLFEGHTERVSNAKRSSVIQCLMFWPNPCPLSHSYQLGTMSCIRSGHDDYPSPETLMHSDHQPGFNGLTSTSVGEAVPPDPPPPERAPLKPALSHIDFWPSCQTRALRACEATFEAFEWVRYWLIPMSIVMMVVVVIRMKKGRVSRKRAISKNGTYTYHYIDVIMTTMASQITSLTVVYSIVYSDADQRKH